MKNKENKIEQQQNKKDIGRKARHAIFSVNTVIFTAVVLIVFVLLNVIIEQVPMNMDLTEEQFFTLTEASEKVMDGLHDKVEIYALYDRVAGEADSDKADVIKILDLYNEHEKVDVSYVDISKKPVFVRDLVGENNASDYSSGDYIVKCGEKTKKIAGDDMYVFVEQQVYYFYTQKVKTGLQVENKVTGAIVRVTSEVPKIYWSVDFGEPLTTDAYYSYFLENLDDANYEVLPINLKTQEIPKDASVIFFVRPTADLDEKTVDKLDYWFDRGGHAFFFMDAKDSAGNFITTEFTNFNKIMTRFGLSVNSDCVEDGENGYEDESDSIFSAETIQTGALEDTESYKVYCYNTRSINLLTTLDSSYYETAALLETSTDATSLSLADGKTGLPSKKVVAASSVCYEGHTEEGSKAVVFGSSANLQIMQAQYFGVAGIKMVKDCLVWLDLDAVENPADSIDEKYYNSVVKTIVEVEDTEKNVFAIVVAVALPLAIFIAGFVIWLRRRHL